MYNRCCHGSLQVHTTSALGQLVGPRGMLLEAQPGSVDRDALQPTAAPDTHELRAGMAYIGHVFEKKSGGISLGQGSREYHNGTSAGQWRLLKVPMGATSLEVAASLHVAPPFSQPAVFVARRFTHRDRPRRRRGHAPSLQLRRIRGPTASAPRLPRPRQQVCANAAPHRLNLSDSVGPSACKPAAVDKLLSVELYVLFRWHFHACCVPAQL